MPRPSRLAALTVVALCVAAAPPALAADAHEPNDAQASAAGPLADAREYAGDVASAEDKDWFTFITSGAATVKITAANDTPRGCFGPEFFVFDSAGKRVAKAHPASGRSESATFAAPAAGQYFLRVTPYYIEPCEPAVTKYRFAVAGGLTNKLPAPATAGGLTPPAPGGSGSGSGSGSSSGGSGSGSSGKPPASGGGSSTSKRLLSPALKLLRTSLRGRTLRASGTVATGARGGKVRVTLSRKAGGKTVRAKKTVKVGAGGRWSAAIAVPRALSAAASVRVDVAYVADQAYRAQTARKTVRRTAS